MRNWLLGLGGALLCLSQPAMAFEFDGSDERCSLYGTWELGLFIAMQQNQRDFEEGVVEVALKNDDWSSLTKNQIVPLRFENANGDWFEYDFGVLEVEDGTKYVMGWVQYDHWERVMRYPSTLQLTTNGTEVATLSVSATLAMLDWRSCRANFQRIVDERARQEYLDSQRGRDPFAQ